MAKCDVHPLRDSKYMLEGPEGACYFMCALYELDTLVASTHREDGSNSALPPCGHDSTTNLRGTWWQEMQLEGPTPNERRVLLDNGKKDVGTPTRTQPQQVYLSLQDALLHVLFATQDLYNEDRSCTRYQRWQGWAVQWLREVMLGAR